MTIVYEPRNPLPTSAYSSLSNDHDQGVRGFIPLNSRPDLTLIPSPPSPPSSPSIKYSRPPRFSPSTNNTEPTSPRDRHEALVVRKKARARTREGKTTKPRMKPIPKPQREATQNDDGNWVCTWHGCDVPIREFVRKCEFSKHMDRHERPYKCADPGCENSPGFTYSGGLLRHEREVHDMHGGPKNPLYCPYNDCPRATGQTFARRENLREHLRRRHRSGRRSRSRSRSRSLSRLSARSEEYEAVPGGGSDRIMPVIIESYSSFVELPAAPTVIEYAAAAAARVRNGVGGRGGMWRYDDLDINKRLRSENQELKRKVEAGALQQAAMMEQINSLEQERAELLKRLKKAGLVG
ncbi:putative c2h2 transcription factor [Rosellinia necatrix]|uniref:Putative c2h2 transcription factor n=1 Tax=Rosellinia necatrix TaxID=77044 RepID=A0A1S7UIK6_ROSNE|nr:putative c2h2 transcription factor [Rosellinia necatrix]